MTEQYQQPVPVIVITDSDGSEALYVNGDFRMADDTIYATDIAGKTEGLVIWFSHAVLGGERMAWPQRYADLVPYLEAEE